MKTLKQFFVLIVIALVGIAVVGCKPDPDPVHEHQWGDWTVTKAPTITAEGEETRTCATCGEKETRPVAKLIQREFNDLALARGKIITLIDETNGTTDFKAQGIWQKFNEAFGYFTFSKRGQAKFESIYENGGKITITVIASGSDYEIIGHNIKLSLSFINSNDARYIGEGISYLIEDVMIL